MSAASAQAAQAQAQAGHELLARSQAGDIAATSRLMTALESGSPTGDAVRAEVHGAGGHAHIVGITGAPGAGKSVLVGALTRELRARERTVGIVAIDPSSSLSGGAILGDRIRMQEHALDQGVFVRSLSSRGWLGGVSRAAVDVVAVLDAAGWDTVIVETVGVGQAEVEIVSIADTTVVVSVPGLGDDIQAIKAGLLEVADLHVVNKADRPGADRTMADLSSMLTLAGPPAEGQWATPVLGTSGLTGDGVAALADAIDGHLQWLRASGSLAERRRRAAIARIQAAARDLLADRLRDPARQRAFLAAVEDVAARRRDAYTAAAELINDSRQQGAS